MRNALLTLAICLMFLSCAKQEERRDVAVGDAMPEILVPLSDGTVFSSATSRQGAVLVVFFNTGCPDCREEFPHVQRVFDEMSSRVRVVAISREEGESSVQKYWRENGLSIPYHADGTRELFQKFASSVIPRCYLFKDGVVVALWDDSPVMKYDDVLPFVD